MAQERNAAGLPALGSPRRPEETPQPALPEVARQARNDLVRTGQELAQQVQSATGNAQAVVERQTRVAEENAAEAEALETQTQQFASQARNQFARERENLTEATQGLLEAENSGFFRRAILGDLLGVDRFDADFQRERVRAAQTNLQGLSTEINANARLFSEIGNAQTRDAAADRALGTARLNRVNAGLNAASTAFNVARQVNTAVNNAVAGQRASDRERRLQQQELQAQGAQALGAVELESMLDNNPDQGVFEIPLPTGEVVPVSRGILEQQNVSNTRGLLAAEKARLALIESEQAIQANDEEAAERARDRAIRAQVEIGQNLTVDEAQQILARGSIPVPTGETDPETGDPVLQEMRLFPEAGPGLLEAAQQREAAQVATRSRNVDVAQLNDRTIQNLETARTAATMLAQFNVPITSAVRTDIQELVRLQERLIGRQGDSPITATERAQLNKVNGRVEKFFETGLGTQLERRGFTPDQIPGMISFATRTNPTLPDAAALVVGGSSAATLSDEAQAQVASQFGDAAGTVIARGNGALKEIRQTLVELVNSGESGAEISEDALARLTGGGLEILNFLRDAGAEIDPNELARRLTPIASNLVQDVVFDTMIQNAQRAGHPLGNLNPRTFQQVMQATDAQLSRRAEEGLIPDTPGAEAREFTELLIRNGNTAFADSGVLFSEQLLDFMGTSEFASAARNVQSSLANLSPGLHGLFRGLARGASLQNLTNVRRVFAESENRAQSDAIARSAQTRLIWESPEQRLSASVISAARSIGVAPESVEPLLQQAETLVKDPREVAVARARSDTSLSPREREKLLRVDIGPPPASPTPFQILSQLQPQDPEQRKILNKLLPLLDEHTQTVDLLQARAFNRTQGLQ